MDGCRHGFDRGHWVLLRKGRRSLLGGCGHKIMPVCARCHKELPDNSFGPRPSRPTGKNYSCRGCCNAYNREYLARWRTPEKMFVYNNRAKKKIRDAVFSHYGWYCMACKESDPMVLSIDHIHNNGAEHRKQIFGRGKKGRPPSGYWLYYWLLKNKLPEGFQVLCMNCNTAKHKNHGVIPPQRFRGVGIK